MQGADLSYGGASSCHGYYLYTLFCPPPKNQQQLDYPVHGHCVCSMSHLNQGSVSDLAVQCLDMWCQVHVQQEVILQETAQSYTALSVCVRALILCNSGSTHSPLTHV